MQPFGYDPAVLIGGLGLVMILATTFLFFLPGDRCSECPHCQRAARDKKADAKRRHHDWLHAWGNYPRDPAVCPLCRENNDKKDL